MRVNLTGDVNNNDQLLIDQSQGRLGSLPLFGYHNEIRIRLSKIRLHLSVLFPMRFRDNDIDLGMWFMILEDRRDIVLLA